MDGQDQDDSGSMGQGRGDGRMLSDQELRVLIADALEVPLERITWEADLLIDLSADSLSLAELCAVLEQKTGRSIPADRLPDIVTAGDLRDLVSELEQ